MICLNKECQEYQDILKEQLEDKARLIESMTQLIRDKDQEILLMKELLKGNQRMNDL